LSLIFERELESTLTLSEKYRQKLFFLKPKDFKQSTHPSPCLVNLDFQTMGLEFRASKPQSPNNAASFKEFKKINNQGLKHRSIEWFFSTAGVPERVR